MPDEINIPLIKFKTYNLRQILLYIQIFKLIFFYIKSILLIYYTNNYINYYVIHFVHDLILFNEIYNYNKFHINYYKFFIFTQVIGIILNLKFNRFIIIKFIKLYLYTIHFKIINNFLVNLNKLSSQNINDLLYRWQSNIIHIIVE